MRCWFMTASGRTCSPKFTPVPRADKAPSIEGNGHAVIAGFDSRRQFPQKRPVIHVYMHIGEDGPPGLYPGDPFQGAGQMGMAGMGGGAQRVHNPAFDPFQRRISRLIQRIDIGGIGQRAEAKAQSTDGAMLEAESPDRRWPARSLNREFAEGFG